MHWNRPFVVGTGKTSTTAGYKPLTNESLGVGDMIKEGMLRISHGIKILLSPKSPSRTWDNASRAITLTCIRALVILHFHFIKHHFFHAPNEDLVLLYLFAVPRYFFFISHQLIRHLNECQDIDCRQMYRMQARTSLVHNDGDMQSRKGKRIRTRKSKWNLERRMQKNLQWQTT